MEDRGNTSRSELIIAEAADGLNGVAIADKLGMPRSTVYAVLKEPETRREIGDLVAFYRSIVDRHTEREVASVIAHAARIARGEADEPGPAQMELIRYFLGWGGLDASSATTAQGSEEPPKVVHVHLGEKWRPELPEVIDG